MFTRPFMLGALVLAGASICQAEPAKPPPPSQVVPELKESDVTIACVGCDSPFGSEGHKEAMAALVSNVYAAELRRALFYQDSVHQFESKAHYDNCDFEAATAYVDELLAEADGHIKSAALAASKNDKAGIEAAGKRAFFAIGQALHAVQDFYAHSNYIELTEKTVKDAPDIPVVPVWTAAGKARLQQLQGAGLVSGYVYWGFPQKCPAGTLWHKDLAKDSEKTTSGKVRVAHLENLSQYRLAIITAREASSQFLTYTFNRWPLLKQLNGKYLAFEVAVDRRGI
jgi:Heterokaryon incompatibility protein Het-C